MNDLDCFARIVLSHHALDRIRERLGDGYRESDARAEIRVALLVDRVTSVKPNWAYGDGSVDGSYVDHARFVWDKDAVHCWVVVPNRSANQIVVKTVLLSIEEQADAGQRMRLRGRR